MDEILKAALKDPVAFFGGVFAGALALDLTSGLHFTFLLFFVRCMLLITNHKNLVPI